MPVNVIVTFILGSALAWILIKITRPPKHLEGLILGCCSAGTLFLCTKKQLMCEARDIMCLVISLSSEIHADKWTLTINSFFYSVFQKSNCVFQFKFLHHYSLPNASCWLSSSFGFLWLTGNLGNLPIIIIPAICKDKDSPFGEPDICYQYGMAYVSLSMAVCNFVIPLMLIILKLQLLIQLCLDRRCKIDHGKVKITLHWHKSWEKLLLSTMILVHMYRNMQIVCTYPRKQ